MREVVLAIMEELLSFTNKEKEVQIFPHLRIDGDCIGSAAALVAVLSKLNIKAKIYMDEPISSRLQFMNIPDDYYEVYDDNRFDEYFAKQGVAVAVDCSVAGRMGNSGRLFAEAEDTIVVDHHVSSGNASGKRYIVSSVASTSELILDVVRHLEKKTKKDLMDPFVANCLMVGIQSDTGRFSYQNTTADTLRDAADLLEHGANVHMNAYYLFDLTSVERMQLIARAMSGAKLFYDGQLAIAMVTQEMLRDTNASQYAADGLVSGLRDIEGVVVSFVIREAQDGEIRVNIRSKDPFDSAAFAGYFDGGGHYRAAGFTIQNTDVNEVLKMIVDKAGEYFSG